VLCPLVLAIVLSQPPPPAEPVAAPAPDAVAPATATATATPAVATTTSTVAEEAALRSAAAAERAAEAAQKAAEAALKAVEATRGLVAPPVAEGAPAEEKKAEPKGPTWTGTVALGFVSLGGNARSVSLTGSAAAERKSDNWIFGMKVGGAYGQAQVADSAGMQTVALNANVQAREAFRFTPRYSAYLVQGIDSDHVASIESRAYGEAGLGILWLDEMQGDFSKLKLGTDVAFRAGRELRQQYYPEGADLEDVTLVAPRVGLSFRYALNQSVIFTEEAEVLPNVVGESRWLMSSTSKITARIVSPLSVSVALQVNHDTSPAPGKVDTDTALTFGVEAGF